MVKELISDSEGSEQHGTSTSIPERLKGISQERGWTGWKISVWNATFEHDMAASLPNSRQPELAIKGFTSQINYPTWTGGRDSDSNPQLSGCSNLNKNPHRPIYWKASSAFAKTIWKELREMALLEMSWWEGCLKFQKPNPVSFLSVSNLWMPYLLACYHTLHCDGPLWNTTSHH